MKRLFSLMLFIATLFTLSAKSTGKTVTTETATPVAIQQIQLQGKVSDKQTQEMLAGAVITVNGQKVYSDLDGRFSVSNLCNGKCKIKVGLISYEDQTIEVDLAKSEEIQIKLQQR